MNNRLWPEFLFYDRRVNDESGSSGFGNLRKSDERY